MRIDIAAFTERGHELGKTLARGLDAGGDIVTVERCGSGGKKVGDWAAERFAAADALVFVGAAGIAARAVAPLLVSKLSDPAVVVIDDCGAFAVSLLSGHVGGGNALALRIAGLIDATPVVTTATDASGLFAVDTWAARRGLTIVNPERIRNVSGKLLSGGEVTLRSRFPHRNDPPAGFHIVDTRGDVVVDIVGDSRADALLLVPPVAVLGVGCRRGVDVDRLERAFMELCYGSGLRPEAIGKVCSIDRKADEPGLVQFCARRRLPLETFAPEALAALADGFAASDFVRSVTGVDNVCERSAVLGSGGELLLRKHAADGIAMAVAVGEYVLDFPSNGGG